MMKNQSQIPNPKSQIRMMLVVGEPSGDAHAAELVKKLREFGGETDFEFFGTTGEKMREEGVETIVKADELSIMGLLEIGRALPMFWRVFQTLKRTAKERNPDAVVLVDFPDFNLPLAKALKKLGLRVIYYISPQLWAWRSYRVRNIRRDVDLLLAILPFEKSWYERRGVLHVEFVGHPLVGEVKPRFGRAEFCRKYDLDETKPIVALLPGSRRKEISRILPPILDATAILHEKNAEIQFVLPLAPSRSRSEIEEKIELAKEKKVKLPEILIVENEMREAVASSDAAIVASGTATLETALLETPLTIVYKVAAHNWHTLRHLINVEHYGLVNLIAEERLAQELIQNDCNGAKIAKDVWRILQPEENRKMREKLGEIVKKMSDGGASEKAARKILEFVRK